MAAPAIIGAAATAGIIVSEVTPTTGAPTTTSSIVIGAVVAVLVAVIGGSVQLYISRHRNDDPKLTDAARLAVLETNQAEMRRDVDEILAHIHPWPADERRKR